MRLADFKAPKKEEKNSGLKSKAQGCGRGTIIRLYCFLSKITGATNGEMYTLVRGIYHTLKPIKKKKKSGLKSKVLGGGRRTFFRLLGILPKITDERNDERYTLFRSV